MTHITQLVAEFQNQTLKIRTFDLINAFNMLIWILNFAIIHASLEEFDGASRRPPFASNRDESAMPTAGRHFKIQIRIPLCLFDWIAFACQKRIVLRGDHEQWDF